MKNLIYILFTIILFSCSEKRVTLDELSETGGYYYFEGKKFTGVGFEMYNSNQVKHELHFQDGEKYGEEKFYSENGDLTTLRTYKNNEYDGPYETYYEIYDGSKIDSIVLESKGNYKNGKLDGESTECIDCRLDISPSGENSFKVEKLFVTGKYSNGVRTGKFQYFTKSNPSFNFVTYDENGKILDGVEINSNNYWEDIYLNPRKIK